MPRRSVRVLVFSGAALFRDGLCSLLEQSDVVTSVTCVGDWPSVLVHLDRGETDTVIIDRDDQDPDAVIDDLFMRAPRIRIVLVSSQDNRLAVLMQSPAEDSYQPHLIAAVTPSGLSS